MSETGTIVLAAAFGASVVWLAVRIANRRERWAIRVAAGIIALLLYVLAFGPLHWCYHRPWTPASAKHAIDTVYTPLALGYSVAPDRIRTAFDAYDLWWMRSRPGHNQR